MNIAIRSLTACVLVLSLAAPLFADDVSQASIRVADEKGHRTATVIHRSQKYGTYALTCRHGMQPGRWYWDAASGQIAGRWRVQSPDCDLALLWDPSPNVCTASMPVAGSDSPEGTVCVSAGFDQPAGGESFSKFGGHTLRRWSSPIMKIANILEDKSGRVKSITENVTKKRGGPGRSGGGLFNPRGELIGICIEERVYGCTFVGHDSIVRFLNLCQAQGYLPWWSPIDEASQNSPALLSYHTGWGNIYRDKRQFATAIRHYSDALAIDATKTALLFERAELYHEQKNYERAIADFDAILGLDPKSARAYNCRGNAQRALGRFELARADYQAALGLQADDAFAHNGLGHTYYAQGQYAAAIRSYDEALRLEPQSSNTRFRRGNAHYAAAQYAAAAADYEQALKLEPGQLEVRNCLANLLATCPDVSLRNPKQAVEYAQIACERSQWKQWRYLHTLALASAAADQQTDAAKWQALALALAPAQDKAAIVKVASITR